MVNKHFMLQLSCILLKPRLHYVRKEAFPVLTPAVGMAGHLPEDRPGQAVGNPPMDTFWRQHLPSSDFRHGRCTHPFPSKSGC